jgi:S-adenosylmethionine decarboxylase
MNTMTQTVTAMPSSVQYKRILIDGTHYYGKHMILTAVGCNHKLLEIPAITEFLTQLVKKIDMVAYGDPFVARFGSGIEEGISAVQLIETSAITIHTNDTARDLYLDVFSCKSYKDHDVTDFVDEMFGPKSTEYQILLRK